MYDTGWYRVHHCLRSQKTSPGPRSWDTRQVVAVAHGGSYVAQIWPVLPCRTHLECNTFKRLKHVAHVFRRVISATIMFWFRWKAYPLAYLVMQQKGKTHYSKLHSLDKGSQQSSSRHILPAMGGSQKHRHPCGSKHLLRYGMCGDTVCLGGFAGSSRTQPEKVRLDP